MLPQVHCFASLIAKWGKIVERKRETDLGEYNGGPQLHTFIPHNNSKNASVKKTTTKKKTHQNPHKYNL